MALSARLSSLASSGMLQEHDAEPAEVKAHIATAGKHLADAQRKENSLETRFTVAYTAGHMLLVAAVKIKGYRTTSEKGHRVVLYQLLDDLLPGAANAKDTLASAHNLRNKAEYEGSDIDVTQGQIDDLVAAVKSVKEEVDYLYIGFKREHEARSKASEQQAGAPAPSSPRPAAAPSKLKTRKPPGLER